MAHETDQGAEACGTAPTAAERPLVRYSLPDAPAAIGLYHLAAASERHPGH